MTEQKPKYKLLRIDKLRSSQQPFIQVPQAVFEILHGTGKSKGNAYMLYSYIIDKYNKEKNYAWPSQNKIMKDLDLSKNAVITATKILEEKNLLKVHRVKSSEDKNEVNKYVAYFPVAINPLTPDEEEEYPDEIYI